MPDVWTDDQLLAVLKESRRIRRDVPADFTEAGQNVYAWHNIDAELAQLSYDSLQDRAPAPSVRSETASIRALTLTSDHLTIEMEVNADSLLCQLFPTGEAMIELETRAGIIASIQADEVGCFAIRPIPASPFRLRCRITDGTNVVTVWITL